MSEKQYTFSDMKTRPSDSLVQKIHHHFKAHPGAVLGASDFVSWGRRAAVDKALSRLVAQREIQRLGRGLYHRPRKHPKLGDLAPNPQAIADAVAVKGALRLQPAGAYAANLLGLSEQVPRKLAFLTDGANRKLRVAGQLIELRHTTPRNMATAGRVSGLLIQALRHLRREQVDAGALDALRQRFSSKEKAELMKDADLAPAWIAQIIRLVAMPEGKS